LLKIVWGNFDEDEIFVISVDGVHCRTAECRKHPSRKWYSHKFAGPGLAYELGIAIRRNQLVWMRGPFMASTHDITIFREEGGLMSKIPAGKRVIGDSGYKGESETVVAVRNPLDTYAVKKFKNRARARHENFNARIKIFKILDERFRHGLEKHQVVFEAVCVITQYALENCSPLFDV
jgi:hypothetical protein